MHCIERFKFNFFNFNNWFKFNIILYFVLLIFSLINLNKLYTSFSFITCSIIMISLHFNKLKLNYNYFYTACILIFIPFLIVDGALTGIFYDKIVVWYNQEHNLGIRIFAIPFEI